MNENGELEEIPDESQDNGHDTDEEFKSDSLSEDDEMGPAFER